jgi:Ni/Co efflux regulator RcnB
VKRLVALLLTITLIGATSVQAQKQKKERKDKDEQVETRREDGREAERAERKKYGFNRNERHEARDSFAADHGRGKCPPGLAKKHNGCLPPGQAKKRYAVGRPLTQGVVYQQLPASLSTRIGPAPTGYLYGLLDGDLIKMNATTRLVVDAIAAFVP